MLEESKLFPDLDEDYISPVGSPIKSPEPGRKTAEKAPEPEPGPEDEEDDDDYDLREELEELKQELRGRKFGKRDRGGRGRRGGGRGRAGSREEPVVRDLGDALSNLYSAVRGLDAEEEEDVDYSPLDEVHDLLDKSTAAGAQGLEACALPIT